MAVCDDVRTALINAGVVAPTTIGADWACFVGYLQDSDPTTTAAPASIIPNRAVCIYETPGRPAEEGFAMDYPDIQVRVRGNPDDYQAVREKLRAIFLALHAQETALDLAVSPASNAYVYFYAMTSGPIPLGQDERRRPHLAQNFRMARNRIE